MARSNVFVANVQRPSVVLAFLYVVWLFAVNDILNILADGIPP